MPLTVDDIQKIAHLARLNLSENDITLYQDQLSNIFHFMEQMNQADTQLIEPVSCSLEINQHLREDRVTEPDRRDVYQSIAPAVEAGLYLVPKVIEFADQ